MKLSATHVAALSLAVTLTAQAQAAPQFPDPANLRGERVQPKTGRELPVDQGALGLQQLLRKLNTRASLMLIVAHPDDEDGGMLTYYSRGFGARVGTLTLTRGEGGQNAMTGDFEDALGLLRTQELLGADRYFGADQMFGTEVDFGFSKTKEEAFRKWTHERVLYDAVRAVRLYRPLVIAAVFTGGVTDGHGQHQVSGEIAQEVFKAAADPRIFPELTREGILPWAPLKVYARVPGFAITSKGLFDYATNQYVPAEFTNYVTHTTTTTPPTPDIILHEGRTDSLLTNAAGNPTDVHDRTGSPEAPLSYVQFARIGLGLQKTQIGPNVRLASAGAYDVSYHLYGSRLCGTAESQTTSAADHSSPKAARRQAGGASGAEEPCVPAFNNAAKADSGSLPSGFFEGIDTSLEAIAAQMPAPPAFLTAGLHDLSMRLTRAAATFDPRHPDRLAPELAEALDLTRHLLQQLPEGSKESLQSVRHELLEKQVQLNDALVLSLGLSLDATTHDAELAAGTPVKVLTRLTSSFPHDLTVTGVTLSSPQGNQSQSAEDKRRDLPLTAEHADTFTLSFAAANTLTTTRPYFFRTGVEQPVYQLRSPDLRNAPASPAALVAQAAISYRGTAIQLSRVVHSGEQPLTIVPPVSLALSTAAEAIPVGQTTTQLTARISSLDNTPVGGKLLLNVGSGWTTRQSQLPLHTGDTSFTLSSAAGSGETSSTLAATAQTTNGDHIRESFRPVGYPGLVYTNLYTPAITRLVPVELKLPVHRHIAYIAGTGDAVASNLRSVGFDVTELTVADLTPDHLSRFDTVILGVRTYNAHPDLHGAPTQALLGYARNGGNVVVQYQTAEFTADDAPFPLTLGNAEKVVDETAPVRLLTPRGLDPSHLAADQGAWRALLEPNHITGADFNGWIEERGHGFLGSWDPHYTALTETHDPGAPSEHIEAQLPQEGGLVTAQLGRGHWTYVAFALYRQLPEAVPGAFRLFTNLLALADTPPQ